MKLYSLKEMAKLWGLSDGLLRRYCRDGRISSAVLEDGSWWIPEGTEKPKATFKRTPAPVLTSLAKRIIYEHSKNNHHGIYEYIQVNLAYSSCRMASNRLTRKQVIEVYRTDKISSAFEPMKVDDLIEMINHFICMRHVIDTLIEQEIRWRYDSWVHVWLVLLAYGGAPRGRKSLLEVFREYDSAELFDVRKLKNHRDYYYGLSKENYEPVIHIYDKKTLWEVAKA